MAFLGQTFDTAQVPQDDSPRDFDPVPAGEYLAQITDSELKETKSGGQMLKLTLRIETGPHAGRLIWDNLNIVNANAQAQGIAHRALRDICEAVGKPAIDDSEELHGFPLVIEVKIEPARGEYKARNGVRRYKSANGGGSKPAARPAPAPQGPAPAQAGHGGSVRPAGRPWGNGAAAARPIHNEPPF